MLYINYGEYPLPISSSKTIYCLSHSIQASKYNITCLLHVCTIHAVDMHNLFFFVLMTPYLILLAKVRGLKTHNSVKLFTKTNHEGLNIYMYRIQGVNTTPVINIYFIVYYILLSYTSGQTNFLTTICFNASCHIFGGFVCIHIYCSPLFLLK